MPEMDECKDCLLGSLEKLKKQYALSKEQGIWLEKELDSYVSSIDETTKMPSIAAELHAILRKISGIKDPYKKEKEISNALALRMYDNLYAHCISSEDPWLEALKLSIAGNVMDYISVPDLYGKEEEYFNASLDKIFKHGIVTPAEVEKLRNTMAKAKNILFLGDNAGEIVMDKLFLRIVKHPNITYAVRGDYILNDVTLEDAEKIGIQKYARLISNGDNAPSTIIERTSKEFQQAYQEADLILSKGQGNFEGLMYTKDERIFFLLMAKCAVIATKLDVALKDIVVKQQSYK